MEGYEGNYSQEITLSPHIQEIRRVYTELTAYYHSQLKKEHRQYLYCRGINDDTIERQQIGYCPPTYCSTYSDPMAYEAGVCYTDKKTKEQKPFFADRIMFPYIVTDDEGNDTVSEIRGRAVNSDAEIKYLSVFRSSRSIDATYPFQWKDRFSKRWLITEGEFKAAAASQHGHKCVALPGMSTWKNRILPTAEDQIIVIFDRMKDRLKQLDVNRAIQRIGERIPRLRVGSLPLLGEEKMDIDSFLIHPKGGENYFTDVVESSIPFGWWKDVTRF
jgi:hypothetical protein